MPSIRKRGNKFHVQVRRAGQQSATKSFTNKRDAEAWARQMEVLCDRRELPLSPSDHLVISLGDLVNRYMREAVSKKRCAQYETILLKAFLRHPICKKLVKDIGAPDFAAYRDERLRHISVASLQRQLNPIRNMFEVARDEWGLPIRENPLDKVKLKAVDNRRERRLKEGELERILEAAKTRKNPYIIPIILFALETAMRRGEILALRWEDIDFQRSTVTIREAKNGYSRTIPLTPKACAIACALVQRIPGERAVKERVFPTSANAVRLSWQRITKTAGISMLTRTPSGLNPFPSRSNWLSTMSGIWTKGFQSLNMILTMQATWSANMMCSDIWAMTG